MMLAFILPHGTATCYVSTIYAENKSTFSLPSPLPNIGPVSSSFSLSGYVVPDTMNSPVWQPLPGVYLINRQFFNAIRLERHIVLIAIVPSTSLYSCPILHRNCLSFQTSTANLAAYRSCRDPLRTALDILWLFPGAGALVPTILLLFR